MQGALLEAEPDVGVELAGFFKGMFGEVEDEDLAAGFKDPVGFFDGALRVLGVVEGLAEDGEVHGGVGERDAFDIAEFIGEVGEAVFGGELGADFDHAGELSIHQTCEARWARSWETRPSPAPRSAIVIAGVRRRARWPIASQERPGQ